ncbi:MAG: gamma-glutamyltransferase family protein [Alphaproteobacteria bacterium]|nr:gamma-glutamyltransferase family protein [Alphaproteobacteria bacterium]
MNFTTRPEIAGTFGVVASTHWLASAVGMKMLEQGGNAFDAAVAAGFTLQVVEPHLNGPLGDMPLMAYDAGGEALKVYCGQGPAPMGATIQAFRDKGLDLIPATGMTAACVPGATDAWLALLQDKGTLPLSDVLAPAIHYAANGYPLVANISKAIESVKELFETEWTTSAPIYLPNGEVPAPGSLFANPALADFYRRLVAESEAAKGSREMKVEAARNALMQGFAAEAIDRFVRETEAMDVSGQRNMGFLTGDDMARWRTGVEDPLTIDYGRFTVAKCAPWSQGTMFLQQLRILDGMGIADMDPTGPDFVHTVIESFKLVSADREKFYADPKAVDLPVETLISREYGDARRALIGETAMTDVIPGDIPGYDFPMDHALVDRTEIALAPAAGAGEPTVRREAAGLKKEQRGDTCHIDIIDRWGNMVSATPSGGWLQSSPAIPELGAALGTRLQMCWLVEDAVSALRPGFRPRSTLSPGFAFRDGKAYMPFGTPGGDQQDQWQMLFFLHHAEHGMNLQEAIDCPAFHTEHAPLSFWPRKRLPASAFLEGRFPEATVRELERRGHRVTVGGDWSEGRLSAASKDGPLLKAAANPRGMQGYAVGR